LVRPRIDTLDVRLDRWWFAGTEGALEPLLAAHVPASAERVVAAADRILAGEYVLFGEWTAVGRMPDWHQDPIGGVRWPRVYAGDINLAASGDGAIRRVWELSRHRSFLTLAQAFALSGQERYATGLHTLWRDWLNTNPPSVGVNWTSGLEMAVRIVCWAWSGALLERAGRLSPELAEAALRGVAEQTRWIEEHPSLYSSANNHRIGEAVGLLTAGLVWPELPGSARRVTAAVETLVTEFERQSSRDGVTREQAIGYQAFVLDGCLWAIELAGRSGVGLPSSFLARVRASARFLRSVMDTRGALPPIGDSDEGWMLPLSGSREDGYRGLLQVAAVCFDDVSLDPDCDVPEEALFWRLGPEGIAAWQALRSRSSVPQSRAFREGGYVVMRAGSGSEERVAVFDCGELGLGPLAAHGHADALAMTLSVGGKPALVDAGTFAYHEDAVWRSRFRGTRAHNTVSVDGRDQSETGGPFLWTRAARARIERRISSSALELTRGSHDGYARAGVTHRRTIVFRRPDLWLVIDELLGTGEHGIEERFHLAPGPIAAEPARFRVRTERVSLIAAPVPGLSMRTVQGCERTGEGWWSPRYGYREPAPELVYEWRGRLPVALVVAVSTGAAPESVHTWPGGGGVSVIQLQQTGRADWVAVTPSARQAFVGGPLSGCGELAWLTMDGDGCPAWLGGLHLERLSWEGNVLHAGLAPHLDAITLSAVRQHSSPLKVGAHR
jgi:hypothetical protein